MRHGSLFSGIGGFDLASHWMGWRNVFQVELDPFCKSILEKHFPDTTRYRDIKEFDGTRYRGEIDIISGGFPCQPFSTAGKRRGVDDPRYLWPEMLRVIREVGPRYVLGENVAGIIPDPLQQVCVDLEREGYAVWPFVIPACAVGAPHRRDRIWILADLAGAGREGALPAGEASEVRGLRQHDGRKDVQVWDGPMPTPTGFCGVDDGLPRRVDRIHSLGNAVVPQVVYQLFKVIQRHSEQSSRPVHQD